MKMNDGWEGDTSENIIRKGPIFSFLYEIKRTNLQEPDLKALEMTYHIRYLTPLILLVLCLQGCKDDQKRVHPEKMSITESVYASVTVQPADKYQVFVNSQGVIRQMYVEEGEVVRKGQRLAEIESTQVEATVDNARVSLELARDKLTGEGSLIREIELEIEAVKEELTVDSANYIRQKNLWEKNIGSKTELENRRLKYQLTQKRLDGLQQRLRQTRNELEKSITKSKNTLKSARATVGEHLVAAKMDALVYELFKEEGELVSPQQPIATLGKQDQFILTMQIDESDIIRVQDSMKIIVTLDAYGDQVFEARVTRIYPTKDPRTQTFEVEGAFMDPPDRLFAGLAGEANIIISSKKDVLTIPLSYIYDENKVKTPDGEKELVLGVRDLERVEVISGLDIEEALIKP